MSYRSDLRVLSFDNHGILTLREAEAFGVPAAAVRRLVKLGVLTRTGSGVYRMNEAPVDDLTEFAEAVAQVGPDAFLVDESVLAAHGLAQINLRTIKVGTPHRVRRSLPRTVSVQRRELAPHDRDNVGGIPAMSVAAALAASVGRLLPERALDALEKAAGRGLINNSDKLRILTHIKEISK
ncbi:MAG: type IV toxin-antitoxin system AbiEi family antitoxin domain-containing protein [Promicromonosporaceae bacterium]|nr:type IV toxin-antitoxin system AbiEi family antitoxin domain-containing protein [Promicromonosporaceae bacterium]